MELQSTIRTIPDFPKEGISFKDITTLLSNPQALKQTIDQMCARVGEPIDLVVGPEARGFIFGSAMAYQLNAGLVLARKPGKLPGEALSVSYDLEYGSNSIEIHAGSIQPGDRVIIADDLIATGGTLAATVELIEKFGGVVGCIVALIELTDLKGRDKLAGYRVETLIEYDH